LLVLLCILSVQMVGLRLLLAENNMSLTASPTSVPADGFTSSLITAVVDTNGIKEAGVKLDFTTTLGSFSSGSATITTYTDDKGSSVVSLTSSSTGTASVRCKSAGGIVRVVNVKFVEVTKDPYLSTFVLTADPPSVPVVDLTPAKITAQLYDQFGKSFASPGVSVVFSTTPAGLAHFSNNQPTITVSTDGSGKATALLYSQIVGTATVNANIGSLTTDPVYVSFTGVGPPAYISLSSKPSWIPADGYSYTAITAVILDSSGQPVAAGTPVAFSTTLGVFGNGKSTYSTVTTDDTGTLTVYLRAANTISTGAAVITCTAGSAPQQYLTINIVRLEYETEPNDDMSHADGVCFNNVFLGQLKSPYEEDWYTFTVTQSSRISINFITTAAPADAGCDSGTTTVGTWKVDIRDSYNNVLMSFHNIDCIFDNGIWETGVVPPGTYYIVVYCPRLGTGDIYLSDPYYLAVFNNFYRPCGEADKLVNAASLSLETSAYHLYVPVIETTPILWADLLYDPSPEMGLMFRLKNYGVLPNLNDFRSCNMSNMSEVDGNYVLHIPVLIFNGVSYRVDLTYVPTTDGTIWFMLSGFWLN
jgi:hypothetical protein